MFAKLALLFIVVPIIEIALLVKVGQLIDFWPTFAIVVTTGVLGAYLAKLQGGRALSAIKLSLSRGELPGDALLDGLLVLIAGIVLVTPGLLTDVTGILLLVPPIRARLRNVLKARLTQSAVGHGRQAASRFAQRSFRIVDITPDELRPDRGGHDDVIDGEVIDVSPERDAQLSRD